MKEIKVKDIRSFALSLNNRLSVSRHNKRPLLRLLRHPVAKKRIDVTADSVIRLRRYETLTCVTVFPIVYASPSRQ